MGNRRQMNCRAGKEQEKKKRPGGASSVSDKKNPGKTFHDRWRI
jgi:hypothetical protein